MKSIRTATFFLVTAIAVSALAASAHANRPIGGPPEGKTCKGFVHSNTKKAKKLSKAQQRARGSWERVAFFKIGAGAHKWGSAGEQHYDCHKKKKWYHCRVGSYLCRR